MNKVLTVRLDENQVAQLTSLATFDGVAIAEEIREGISLLLERRKQDPEFRARVIKAYRDAERLLTQLDRGEEILAALGDPAGALAAELVPA